MSQALKYYYQNARLGATRKKQAEWEEQCVLTELHSAFPLCKGVTNFPSLTLLKPKKSSQKSQLCYWNKNHKILTALIQKLTNNSDQGYLWESIEAQRQI